MRPNEVTIRRVVCDKCGKNSITARAGLGDAELNALAILLGWRVNHTTPGHVCPACAVLDPSQRVRINPNPKSRRKP